jgi:hypothetical protein
MLRYSVDEENVGGKEIEKIGNTKAPHFVSNNVQFSTKFCDFEVAILYIED